MRKKSFGEALRNGVCFYPQLRPVFIPIAATTTISLLANEIFLMRKKLFDLTTLLKNTLSYGSSS